MFGLDFLVFAAAKRAASTTHAFTLLIKTGNMLCARSILRLHIDTALRFSAAWYVEKPHDFALKVLADERIDRVKDRSGQRLTDARLVDIHLPKYPWLKAVYTNLSGYVHFSSAHIFGAMTGLRNEDNVVGFEVSDVDTRFPEASWIEIIDCFREANAILGRHLEGYAMTKRMTPEQLQKLKKSHAGA